MKDRLNICRVSGCRCPLQLLQVAAFGTEGNVGAAEPRQQRHAAIGKVLGTAAGEQQRQLEDKVAAGRRSDSESGPLPLIHDGYGTALSNGAAHDDDDPGIGTGLAQLADLIGMAVVEGIVFSYYADQTHDNLLRPRSGRYAGTRVR